MKQESRVKIQQSKKSNKERLQKVYDRYKEECDEFTSAEKLATNFIGGILSGMREVLSGIEVVLRDWDDDYSI